LENPRAARTGTAGGSTKEKKKNRGAGTKGGHGHAWDVSEFAIE